MDDNFLSFAINIIVNVVMLLATMSKFYIEDRPNVAEVIKENILNLGSLKSNSCLLVTEMTQFHILPTRDMAMIHTFFMSQNINSFKPWTLHIQS